MALGATKRSILGGVSHAHEEGPVGMRWSFFFPFSLFYHALEKSCQPFKKKSTLDCNCINFSPLSLDYYFFFAFDAFLGLTFFQFHPYAFYFI